MDSAMPSFLIWFQQECGHVIRLGELHRAHACGESKLVLSSRCHGRSDKVDFAISTEGFRHKGHTQPSTWKRPIVLESPDQYSLTIMLPDGLSLRQTVQSTCTRDMAKIDYGIGRMLMFLHLEQLS